jgi:hypothetical protein
MIRAAIAICIALVAGTSLSTQQQATARGRVTGLSGIPVEGAGISFYHLGISTEGPPATERLVRQLQSGPDGTFLAKGLPPGEYRVSVQLLPIFKTEVWRFYLSRGAERVLDIGLPQIMQHGLETISVRGTVRDEKGDPLRDATVTLVAAYNLGENSQARTDGGGRFELATIQPGEYVVWAAKDAFRASATTLRLTSGARQTLTLTLEPRR